MKITIITPSYNQGEFIEETILSVLQQKDSDFEHLVIDGGSSDDTVDILKRYPHLTWVSEHDQGQADALRKGLGVATGEIIGWINSDDYYERDVFPTIRRAFTDPQVQWVVGDLAYMYQTSRKVVVDHSPKITHPALIKDPDIVRQQSTFFRKDFLERAGGWEPRYHMTMDYDLWTRLARLAEPLMLSQPLAYFRLHKAQKTSEKNIQVQADELAEIMCREGATEVAVATMRRIKKRLITKLKIKIFLVRIGLLNDRYLAQPLRSG